MDPLLSLAQGSSPAACRAKGVFPAWPAPGLPPSIAGWWLTYPSEKYENQLG